MIQKTREWPGFRCKQFTWSTVVGLGIRLQVESTSLDAGNAGKRIIKDDSVIYGLHGCLCYKALRSLLVRKLP